MLSRKVGCFCPHHRERKFDDFGIFSSAVEERGSPAEQFEQVAGSQGSFPDSVFYLCPCAKRDRCPSLGLEDYSVSELFSGSHC